MEQGIFYGVSVGPGDPELLTLKAVRLLERCPVIAAPQTKSGEMLALKIASGAVSMEGKTIVPLYFPMERDREILRAAHLAAAEQVEAHLAAGRDVAMLSLGDASVYSTCAYLMDILRPKGWRTELTPGVPSFCAAAARLNISLTEMHTPFHIAPGPDEAMLDLPGTKVLMKSGKRLPKALEALRARGKLGRSALVENCGLPGERLFPDLSKDAPESGGYFATLIVKE